MDRTARIYQCQACRALIVICSHCDRGQQYCHHGCADEARRASLRRAGCLYQSRPKGRRNNAKRQASYRARQREKVTHQGSVPDASRAPLLIEPKQVMKKRRLKVVMPDGFKSRPVTCHFCRKTCHPFLRREFSLTSRRYLRAGN